LFVAEIPMTKIVADISPPPKISSVKHEVDCQNKNMVCLVGGDVELQNQKVDFTRVKARVDTAKKTQMQDDTINKVSGKMTTFFMVVSCLAYSWTLKIETLLLIYIMKLNIFVIV
jgi:hypothetical protein